MSTNNPIRHAAAKWLKTFAIAAVASSTMGLAQAAADKPLKLGTTAAFVPALEVAVQEAAAQGVKVELVEFTDWNTPNLTVAKGDIDANYFQHIPFLENANKEGGFNLVPAAIGIIKGLPFEPTDRQRELLDKAVLDAPRMILASAQLGREDGRNLYYTDRQWEAAWSGGTARKRSPSVTAALTWI